MELNKIASFTVDHITMKRGIFVSRKDQFGSTTLTTFDMRMKEPNREPVMDMPAVHSLEHLGATFLRNHPVWKDRTIYFGPMGCRTGQYMILEGDLSSQEVAPLVQEMFQWILDFRGEIPGAAAQDCGNWQDHNLDMAQWEAKKFQKEVLNHLGSDNLNYPH